MATKSLGVLTLDLVAKTSSFTGPLDQASRNAKKRMGEVETSVTSAATALASLGAASAGAMGIMVLSVAQSAKELEQFTTLANASSTEFQRMAYGAKSASIEQEKLASIFKDTTDRIGEFMSRGGGEMKDFFEEIAPLVGVTAEQFKGLSGPEALQLYYNSLEKANIGQQRLTSYMEQVADDATALIPLLKNNGEQFKLMGDEADRLGLVLSDLELEQLNDAAKAIDAMKGAMQGATNQLVIGMLPAINEFTELLQDQGTLDGIGSLISGLEVVADVGAVAALVLGSRLVSAITAKATATILATKATHESAKADVIATTAAQQLATAELANLRLQQQSLASQLQLAQAEKTRTAIRLQLAANATAMVAANAAEVSATNALTAAQARATVTARALTSAKAALSAGTALLGGPVGVVVLAGSALAYFATRASEAEREAEALDRRIKQMGDSFDSFTVAQAKRGILDYTEALEGAELELSTAEARLFTLNKLMNEFPGSEKYAEWEKDATRAAGAVDDAQQKVDALNGNLEKLNQLAQGKAGETLADDARQASKAFEELNKQVGQQIIMLSAKTDAERLAAQVAAGYVEGMTDAELAQIQAMYQSRDALEAKQDATDKATKAAESKAESERRAAAAVMESVHSLVMEANQLGMTNEQIRLNELRTKGATAEQLKMAAAAMATVEAFEAQRDINADASAIIESLRTEEEAIEESYERRREIILAATELTEQARTEAMLRLEQERADSLMEINGGYWERYLEAAEESLTNFDELAGNMLDSFSSRFGNAFESMIFDAESLEEAMAGMAEGMLRSVVNAIGQMIAQWLAYQVVQMVVGKTAQSSGAAALSANAYASSMLAGINAFSSTAAIPIVGPALAPAAMATALSVTMPMAAGVTAAAAGGLAGMAHDGIDSVPEDGTWLLQKGERVTTASTSDKLDRTLEQIKSQRGDQGGGGAANVTVNLIEDRSKAGQVEQRQREDGSTEINAFVADIGSGGERAQMLEQTYGLQRRGR